MKRGTSWPIGVGMLLGACVAANVWIIRVATRDPSFAVEENYYERALRWDDELAQRARSRALAWQLVPSISPAGAGAELRVELRDANGAPLNGAAMTVRAIHNARAGAPVDAALARDGTGGYVALLPMRRAGLWELRFDVRLGEDHFTAQHRLELASADQ